MKPGSKLARLATACSRAAPVIFAWLILLLSSPRLAIGAPAVSTATYRFNDTLSADEPGTPQLLPIDPFNRNHFESATIYGNSRRVYHLDGTPQQQAGLSMLTSGIVGGAYSVEMVVQLLEGDNSYRRLFETQNRQLDEGFYVDPSNRLTIYPVATGDTPFVTGKYHYVALTFDDRTAQVFLDGVLQFTANAPMMDLNNGNNLYRVMNFFLDNVGAFSEEYANANVALIRLTADVLSADEVAARAVDPFAIPEPAAWMLALTAVATAAVARRLRKARSCTTSVRATLA